MYKFGALRKTLKEINIAYIYIRLADLKQCLRRRCLKHGRMYNWCSSRGRLFHSLAEFILNEN